MQPLSIFLATILNPISDTQCDYFPEGALVVKGDKVVEVGPRQKILKKYAGKSSVQFLDYTDYVILPAFFDMHFHWVQDDVRQMPKDNLLTWLKNYTWPYEAKFKNKNYAKKKAKEFFKKLALSGTLGGACYSSIHGNALENAMDAVKGDFVIGNVLMTMNSPVYLSQTEKEAVELVKKYSTRYKHRYAMTPRFAITTHMEVMQKGSALAKKNKSFMQTHLSETENEIDFVLSLFPESKTYTDIYSEAGMLGPKTIMGHGIYLSDRELKLLAKSKTAIAHCPTSNAPIKEKGLGSGLFNFEKIEKYNVRWALGSDIGGGPFLSMFDVMRSFVLQNKKNKKATFVKALYRATVAGAELLNLQKTHGNLAAKKQANFIMVKKPRGKFKTAEELIGKITLTHQNSRDKYDYLIDSVFHQGKALRF